MATPDISDLPHTCREHIKNKETNQAPQANIQNPSESQVLAIGGHVHGEFREEWAGSAAIRDGLGRVETEERKGVKGLMCIEYLIYTRHRVL